MDGSECPSFGVAERRTLDRIDRWLRKQGWADSVTVIRLLQGWQELGQAVDRYAATIYEYANDLTRRDALEIVLGKWHEPLRDKVLRLIGQADHEFFIRTHADTYGVLPRHIRVNRSSAWWWHRVPSASSHTDFLEVGRRDRS